MKNWVKIHLRMVRLLRYHGFVTPWIAVILFFLYSYDIIGLVSLDISFVVIVFSFVFFLNFLYTSKRDFSLAQLVYWTTFTTLVYYGIFILASEPVSGFRINYKPLVILQILITVLFIFYLFRNKTIIESASSFNGVELKPEERKIPTLIWIDNRPFKSEMVRAFVVCLIPLILPFVWYWIAVNIYEIPKLGAAFIGMSFWSFMNLSFIISVLFPFFSRQSFIQIRKDGILGTESLDNEAQQRIKWEEIGKMEFHKIVDANIAITGKTGDRWIRGLTPNSIRLIEVIVRNGWYRNIEGHIEEILSEAFRLGMSIPKPSEKGLYNNFLSHEWIEQKIKSNEFLYVYIGLFVIMFFTGILVLGLSEGVGSYLAYLLIGLSFIFLLAISVLFGKFLINLRIDEDVFDRAGGVIEDTLEDLDIEYDSRVPYENVIKFYILKLGKGYFGNPRIVISGVGEGVRVSVHRGSKENEDICRRIMKITGEVFKMRNLMRPPQIILR